MRSREQLHEELCMLLDSTHAYFQPPENLKLAYPCFVYSMNTSYVSNANNHLYLYEPNYQLVYITDDPETDMELRMLKHFKKCRAGQPYVSDNLYHHPFDLYY